MNDTQKMLQAIINGQSTLKQELLSKIDKVDKKVDGLDVKLDKVEKNLTARIDKFSIVTNPLLLFEPYGLYFPE